MDLKIREQLIKEIDDYVKRIKTTQCCDPIIDGHFTGTINLLKRVSAALKAS